MFPPLRAVRIVQVINIRTNCNALHRILDELPVSNWNKSMHTHFSNFSAFDQRDLPSILLDDDRRASLWYEDGYPPSRKNTACLNTMASSIGSGPDSNHSSTGGPIPYRKNSALGEHYFAVRKPSGTFISKTTITAENNGDEYL